MHGDVNSSIFTLTFYCFIFYGLLCPVLLDCLLLHFKAWLHGHGGMLFYYTAYRVDG